MPEGCVIHSFRHSTRDRLRAVNCSADMIDQIGGWSKKSVGEGYGEELNFSSIQSRTTGVLSSFTSLYEGDCA